MSSEIVAALRAVALFRSLSDDELDTLARQVVRKRYGRNQVIFLQGQRGDGLYVVLQGHVGISRESAEGDELLLVLYAPGESFGELALFDQEPRSATAIALDACVLLLLPYTAFQAFLQAHPAAVMACLRAVVGQLRRLTDVADEIALLDVRSRLARWLIRLADQGLVDVAGAPGPRMQRPLRITQQHLANMVGATRESVNKQLQAFAAEGLITLDGGQVRIVDRAGLYACGEGLA